MQVDFIHKLFEKQVERKPENIALICNENKITYKDLNEKADSLTNLINKYTKKGNIIGIEVKRSINMIVGILAILKTGSAYLPIDYDYPEERINYMLEDSGVKLLIKQNCLIDKANSNIQFIDLDDNDIFDEDKPNLVENIDANDLAYIIYTSGSTGKPKGVMVKHQSVINLFNGITEIIDFSEGKKILALTSISFDMCVLEMLLPLTKGLTVVLADESTQKNPKLLSDLIVNNEVDMLQMTPSSMQLLINYDKDIQCIKNLKEIMIGAEVFPKDLLEKLKSVTKSRIYNMYGPTETTVWSTVSELTKKNSVDIGKPIINTQIYIVDENNNLVPEGVEGELCIGGCGLAKGYLNRPELTDERFITNPFVSGEKIYKTGDLARWLPDGNIECLGRIDNQVKIRGYRIELGEIESVLLKYKSIKQAVVSVWQGKEKIKYLCAYYVSDEEILSKDLREFLSITLPEYMVPTYFIRLNNIPQTPNNKIDRKALLEPESTLAFESKKEVQHCDEKLDFDTYFKIREIIRCNIDIPIPLNSTDFDCNLFDLGINSITFIKIVVAIETEFDFEFDDKSLEYSKFPTIQSLVDYVKNMSID